ncbi:MAG: hypothetical protein HBSAPP03_08230 [Phycisphaerae bacterium]|nr:MAG: hypothetical protein HBSAPP03_08230 [Phycisphaerae bacterium]
MNSVLKAAAALAVMAGSSVSLGQVYCSSPNIPINPGAADPSTMDTINVAGGPTSISNMAVTINVLHTWDSDIVIVLVHNGQTLTLSRNRGGSGDNFINTRFIDAAGTPIASGAAPFTGDFRPDGGDPGWTGTITIPGTFLADFAGWNGQDGNGAWDLVIDDEVNADGGTLQSWCIDFSPGAPPPPPPPPPGDNCADGPIVVFDGATPFSTVGMTTDAAWTCAIGGRDMHFLYTATNTGTYQFSTCGSTYDSAMMLGSFCGGNDYGCLDDGPCGLQQTMSLAMTAGQQVHITIGGYNSAVGSGTLSITGCFPNPYSPPAGTPENEVCGTLPDIDNGGCNSTPNVFHTIACGETILGTGFFNGSTRDTDVFRFTLDADDNVTFVGQAQFDLQLLVLNDACPWSTQYLLATTNACNIDFTTSVFLPAGTYNLWMGPQFTNVVNCGLNDSYWVTMTYGAGCAAPCDPDVNCDGSANGVDVEVQELAVGGDFTDYCQVGIPGVDDGDFNRDGAVNGTDVEAVENAVGGICP